jgi:hypothetical protein
MVIGHADQVGEIEGGASTVQTRSRPPRGSASGSAETGSGEVLLPPLQTPAGSRAAEQAGVEGQQFDTCQLNGEPGGAAGSVAQKGMRGTLEVQRSGTPSCTPSTSWQPCPTPPQHGARFLMTRRVTRLRARSGRWYGARSGRCSSICWSGCCGCPPSPRDAK